MNGVLETEVLVKSLPTLFESGMRVFDFRKTRRELTAAREEVTSIRKELAEKDTKIAAIEEQLKESTTTVVAVTDELVQAREQLSDTQFEYDDYRETMQLVIWGGGAVIVVLLLVVVLTSVRHAGG